MMTLNDKLYQIFEEKSLPVIEPLINDVVSLNAFADDVARLGNVAGEYGETLFSNGIPSLQRAFGEKAFAEYWKDLVSLGEEAGERVLRPRGALQQHVSWRVLHRPFAG